MSERTGSTGNFIAGTQHIGDETHNTSHTRTLKNMGVPAGASDFFAPFIAAFLFGCFRETGGIGAGLKVFMVREFFGLRLMLIREVVLLL